MQGRGPTGPDEVAVESATLDKADLEVGDRTSAVIGGRTSTVTITGEVHFGSLFGATAVLVDPATARRLFSPDGTVSGITVIAEPGVSQSDAPRRSRRSAAGRHRSGHRRRRPGRGDAAAVQEGLGFFTTFLLAFAGVALFVGAFIIVNTFSMLIGQRTRELALLRALGASRGQVLRVVLGEAALVGLVGSGLGILVGIAVAQGAKSAIKGYLGADIGAGLPVNAAHHRRRAWRSAPW